MATATNKKRASRDPSQTTAAAPMEFRVYEDNGGRYHWTILSAAGATLARSDAFATHGEAEDAAAGVRDGAAAADFERGSSERPLAAV